MAAPAKGAKFTLYGAGRQGFAAERAVAATLRGPTHALMNRYDPKDTSVDLTLIFHRPFSAGHGWQATPNGSIHPVGFGAYRYGFIPPSSLSGLGVR